MPSILKEMVPAGLSYGAHYVVEFEPDSLWYETSITATAQAVKSGVKVDYHTFQHSPQKVRDDLTRLGVDVKKREEDSTFRIMDTYTAATGAFRPPSRAEHTGPGGSFWAESVKVSDWSLGNVHDIKGETPEEHKNRFHMDDNTSILFRYNDENEIIDYWRTRVVPWATHLGVSMMHSMVAGVASNTFIKQFQSYCEGIFDLKSQEEDGEMQHYIRVRTMRGKVHDSRWRYLRLLPTGEVVIDTVRPKSRELGFGRWLKGPK